MSHLFRTEHTVRISTPWFWSPYVIFVTFAGVVVFFTQFFNILAKQPWKKQQKAKERKKSAVPQGADVLNENGAKDVEKAEKIADDKKLEHAQRKTSVWSMETNGSKGSGVNAKETREAKIERMKQQIALWKMAQSGVTAAENGQGDEREKKMNTVWSTGSPNVPAGDRFDDNVDKGDDLNLATGDSNNDV
uniref:Uncharacterized protein n=1 Tax=Plectus sambesii TaxID=2011161 RepID=A0A914V8E6_9BILA